MQSFYSDYQKEGESIVTYGCRLEQMLVRAIRCGHIDISAKDSMLRSKFWTGLKGQQLKNSTRHLYDTVKDFQLLLIEIRKVEQEEANVANVVKPNKPKNVQQHTEQVTVQSDNTNQEILKQLSELMGRMQTLEEKMDAQMKSTTSGNSIPQHQQEHTDASFQYRRGGGRGQSADRGRFRYRGRYRGGFPEWQHRPWCQLW